MLCSHLYSCLPSSHLISSPLLYILVYVCVMDGLLYHMSNTNMGLSACTGSSPCKLNLSEAFFFFRLHFLFSLTHCVSKGVWLSWLVFTSSKNIFVILLLSEHGGIYVDLLNKPFCIQMNLYRPRSCRLYLERKDWVLNPQPFLFLSTPHSLTLSSPWSSSLYFSHFQTPSIFSWYLVPKSYVVLLHCCRALTPTK